MRFINKKSIYLLGSMCALLATLSACGEPSFTVKGEIKDADSGTVILEKADHAGYWIALDSTGLSSSGKFTIKSFAPSAPEVYRLNYNGQYIYFPIDSLETISVTSPADAFATDYTLAGSDNAVNMARFEKELIAFSPLAGNPDSLAAFKRHLYTEYLKDAKGSVVSYYILTKVIGDRPLFGTDGDDRYFAAVATAFKQYRPDDPRTALLENVAAKMRRERNDKAGKKSVVEAPEVKLIDIALPDEDGNNVRLSDFVGGKPTLLMFCQLTDAETPALNVKLRTRTAQDHFKVYQVGLDGDRLQWRNSAKNLPWTTLYGGSAENVARLAQAYMIPSLPAYFLIDADGNLTYRATDLNDALNRLP